MTHRNQLNSSVRQSRRHQCEAEGCDRLAVDRWRRLWLCEVHLNPDIESTIEDYCNLPSAAAGCQECAGAPPTLTRDERRRTGV